MSESSPSSLSTSTLPGSPQGWRRYVLGLALPIVISNITVPLTGLVDTAVAGRMPAAVYVSAVSAGTVTFTTLFYTFGFLRMTTSGLIAQSLGQQQLQDIHSTTRRAMVIGALLGIALILLHVPAIVLSLWFMGGSEQFNTLTRDYFEIRVLAAPAALAMSAMVGAMIGRQRTRSVMVLQIVMNGLNIVLTLWLFRVTEWGVRGIAAATVIAEYSTLLLGAWLLRDSLARFRLSELREVFAQRELSRYFRISSHILVRTLCLTAAFYWMTVMGSRQGDLILAANAILLQLVYFMTFALDGFAHAAEALTGQAIGQRNVAALTSAIRAVTELSVTIGVALTAFYIIAGHTIIDLLTTQESVREAARVFHPWLVLAPLVCVWSYLLDGIFIGATQTREMRDGMVLSVLVFILASVLLVPVAGNHGLWLSYLILMVARAITLGVRYPRIVAAAIGSHDPCTGRQSTTGPSTHR